MDLPPHPETDDSATGPRPAPPGRRGSAVAVALVLALVAVLIVLHLTGVVGPGSG